MTKHPTTIPSAAYAPIAVGQMGYVWSEMTKHPTTIPSAAYAPIAVGQMGYVWMKGGIL
jgi:exosome complex RNA-binding protein Rrp4